MAFVPRPEIILYPLRVTFQNAFVHFVESANNGRKTISALKSLVWVTHYLNPSRFVISRSSMDGVTKLRKHQSAGRPRIRSSEPQLTSSPLEHIHRLQTLGPYRHNLPIRSKHR